MARNEDIRVSCKCADDRAAALNTMLSVQLSARPAGCGTKRPVGVALHETALETFLSVARAAASMFKTRIAVTRNSIGGPLSAPAQRRNLGQHRVDAQVDGCLMTWGYSPIFGKRVLMLSELQQISDQKAVHS